MKSILSLSAILLASTTLAYDNSPPIPERHTGYTFRGKTITNIEIEVFYDLLCEGSAYMNPAFQDFLDMPFLSSTVRDSIDLTYTYYPLPYHHTSWVVTELVPYFVDTCYAKNGKCQFVDYMNFCFANQEYALGSVGMS
jgi:hypothetical protein